MEPAVMQQFLLMNCPAVRAEKLIEVLTKYLEKVAPDESSSGRKAPPPTLH
jgi:hypothetical protein